MKKQTKAFCTFLLLALPVKSLAADVPLIYETDWLHTEVGSTGKKIGATVEHVDQGRGDETTVIDLSIPFGNPDSIDTIQVISRETGKPVIQRKQAEWIKDNESDIHELRLFLNKKSNFEFRLRLIDSPEK